MNKKTTLKIIGTILTIMLVIIFQLQVSDYYNIEPRIWFWVPFEIGVAVFFIISILFYIVAFLRKIYEKKPKNIFEKIKTIITKILKNDIYIFIWYIIAIAWSYV